MCSSSKRKRAGKQRHPRGSRRHIQRQGNAASVRPAAEKNCSIEEVLEASAASLDREPAIRVAILSFLFNWPSTGGGIVHTVELADFLGRAGYAIRHFYARNPKWGIGRVTQSVPFDSRALDFDEGNFQAPAIQDRFRQALEEFDPNYVIITDSWNFKPLLAEAASGFPYFLRLQASECLCPLNNLRFLPNGEQCTNHQLANAERCRNCVDRWAGSSGSLHQAERALAGVGTPRYEQALRRAFAEAEAVLVVNELAATMIGPYAQAVRVVTSGFDPERFPWGLSDAPPQKAEGEKLQIFMAGVVEDGIKGFHVLDEACRRLRRERHDFELVATGEPPGQVNDYTRFLGWLSQGQLPNQMRAADVVVVPTIAQDALGRTAVEAMAAGRPVLASRIGGLPFTLADGAGLLFEPGDAADLARKLKLLLDDSDLRRTMGCLGRRRFEEHFTWEAVIDRHYRPLLAAPTPRASKQSTRDETNRPATDSAIGPQPLQSQVNVAHPYVPFIPDAVDEGLILRELVDALDVDAHALAEMLDAYRGFHRVKGYEYKLGELKTLCFEEAFILHAIFSVYRPQVVVEIGAQHGKATRRMLDSLALLGLEARVVTFDVLDQVEYFQPREAELIVDDVSGHFRERVLDRFNPDVVFVDVHRYGLLEEIVRETDQQSGRPVVAIHDCGSGLCNPHMTISKDDPGVTSSTGTWERHVLAAHFGIGDPLSGELDDARSVSHRLRIFSTPHGLGLLIPQRGQAGGTKRSGVAPDHQRANSTLQLAAQAGH